MFDYESKMDQYLEKIEELVRSKRYAELRDLFLPMEPADIALLLEEAGAEQMPLLYRLLPKELAVEVFVELEADSQEMLINGFSNTELQEVLDELYLDDAVDIVEEMPASVVIRILDKATPELRKSINEILKYPEDSAGSIMTVEETAHLTAEQDGLGCAKLVVFCNAVEDNPFMAGAFHGVGEADSVINVGVSGPGVVYHALQSCKGQPFDVVAETVKKTAFQITRMGQMVATEASRRLDTPFGIVDLSLAPTPAVGDSVARILEEMGLETCGTHGTTAALALLNDAVKKGGVMASGHVGGLSGAFIPVSEDEGMIAAAQSGVLTIDKLEAMTCVCSVGLDMIAVPGDTSAETISAIIADEAAVGMVNSKTTAVRIIPVEGKTVGDMIEMGGLLGSAPVMPVHQASSADFIARGGRIPAPLQSLKN